MLRRTLAAFLTIAPWAPALGHAHVEVAPQFIARGLRAFSALAHDSARLSLERRVEFVNISINQRVSYVADETLCGDSDCWQTPAETLALGLGDCEDYAIAKYFLLDAGCKACECERLLYAIRTPFDTPGLPLAHVVLLAGGDTSDPLVLDSLNPLLLPLSQRRDLEPVFSFDVTDLWRGASGARLGKARAMLDRWDELLVRWASQQRSLGLACE